VVAGGKLNNNNSDVSAGSKMMSHHLADNPSDFDFACSAINGDSLRLPSGNFSWKFVSPKKIVSI
jgi:hypothetical protein